MFQVLADELVSFFAARALEATYRNAMHGVNTGASSGASGSTSHHAVQMSSLLETFVPKNFGPSARRSSDTDLDDIKASRVASLDFIPKSLDIGPAAREAVEMFSEWDFDALKHTEESLVNHATGLLCHMV